MGAITEVTDPGLQGWGVVFLDDRSVSDDTGLARNAGPRAVGGEEGDIYVAVVLDVVGLSGFSVGVEEQVNVVFLVVRSIKLFLQ